MTKLFELIFHEVSRQFRSERAFYHTTLGLTQRAWEKYKTGETNFNDIKLSTYKRMTATLFTRYETMLIDEAIEATNFNWYDNVVDAFLDIKVKHALKLLDQGENISLGGGIQETGQPVRISFTKIIIGDKVSFQVNVPSHQIKSGKRNRREWFDREFAGVVVK